MTVFLILSPYQHQTKSKWCNNSQPKRGRAQALWTLRVDEVYLLASKPNPAMAGKSDEEDGARLKGSLEILVVDRADKNPTPKSRPPSSIFVRNPQPLPADVD